MAIDRWQPRAGIHEAEGALLRGVPSTTSDNERLQHRLRKLVATPRGRERLRERDPRRAQPRPGRSTPGPPYALPRHPGLFDLRRKTAVHNLETIDRRLGAAA